MTITDITDLARANASDNLFVLQFVPGNTPVLKISNRALKQIIDQNFEEDEFPEYKKIAYEACIYITRNKLVTPKPTAFDIVVSTDSPLAKGHNKHENYISLFTLIFVICNGKVQLVDLIMNAILVAEKIELSSGEKQYKDTLYDNPEDTVTNTESCTICLQSVGKMVVTPCTHTFHLDCLKCTPKLLCPVCRTDLVSFVVQAGVPQEEIDARLAVIQNAKMLDDFRATINHIDLETLTDVEFLKLCTQSLKLNGGNILAYNDIIFDMNTAVAKTFAKISCWKGLYKRGAFMYLFETVTDFLIHMGDPQSKSVVTWVTPAHFKGTPLYSFVKNKLNQITNPVEEYLVIIMIENVVNTHIVNITDTAVPLSQADIMLSLLKCCRCRYFPENPIMKNREAVWATQTLDKLEHRLGIQKPKK